MSWKTLKITVLKKLNSVDIFGDASPVESLEGPLCPVFEEGQVLYSRKGKMPEGFCTWAWNNIYLQASHLMLGGDYPWIKDKGKAVVCCTDGLKPVVFLLERCQD